MGEIGEVITGSTPSTQHPEYYSEDGMSWVTPTDIVDNIIYDTPRKLSPIGEKVGRVVPADTILVTCIASIGKNAMLVNTGSFNQQINGLVPDKKKYDPYFLLTESFHWSAKMKREAAAGTMQIVNKNEFSAIETYVPELSEQKAIGAYFCQIDKLITLHQRKCINNTIKHINDWEQRKLGEVAKFKQGVQVDLDLQCTEKTENTERFIRIVDYTQATHDLRFVNKDVTDDRVDKNDIVMVRYGATAGYVGRGIKGIIANNMFTVNPNDSVEKDFLYTFLKMEKIYTELNTSNGSSAMPALNFGMVGSLEIVYPSNAEQVKIGNYFEHLDNLITLHQR